MTNLIIAISNTTSKSALSEGEKLFKDDAFQELEMSLMYWESVVFDGCLVSSVRWIQVELKGLIPFYYYYFNAETKLAITNAYETPASLDLDRVAGALGAWSIQGNGSVLVIDLGTCITFELTDESNCYLGEAISTGLAIRAKAMHEQTARLPLVNLIDKPAELIGNCIITCLQLGIWYGIELEILGQIEAYRKKIPEIEVFVSGGDTQSFDSLAKDFIFVVPNLVLYGLNSILNHNVE